MHVCVRGYIYKLNNVVRVKTNTLKYTHTHTHTHTYIFSYSRNTNIITTIGRPIIILNVTAEAGVLE
jgi:hypothetical protein